MALNRKNWAAVADVLTVVAFVVGIVMLISLIWYYVRPIQTADIKVPVATDKPSYAPGDPVSGIFFGETYYKGEVRILREVFCKNYKGIIQPPTNSAVGDFFSTQAKDRKLEGVTVPIGKLPDTVPVGSNCVLQFTNVYDIQTPFGVRHEEYQYYTQNFAIITKERRQQLDCEASGKENCDILTDGSENDRTSAAVGGSSQPSGTSNQVSQQSGTQGATQPQSSTSNNTSTNNVDNSSNTTTNTPDEQCFVSLAVVKVCR